MITNKPRWRYKLIYFNRLGEFLNYLEKLSVDTALEAVQKLMSNKSIPYKSLKVWQETDYPVSPFLYHAYDPKVFSYKGFVSRDS